MPSSDRLKIPLQEILLATNEFAESNIIGKGGYGLVYRGQSEQHGMLAVKRLNRACGQGDHEYGMEISLLAKLKHVNLVSLIGFCGEADEKILVYKYEANQSLDKFLHSKELSWMRRLQICVGAARGLRYLHNEIGTGHGVIHRDIKSSNILLDDNWNAKISDFGLSKIYLTNSADSVMFTAPCGTMGYVDPQILYGCGITQKSDVYSFGVVLYEVLFGKLVAVPGHVGAGRFTVEMAKKHYQEKTLHMLIHPDLTNEMKRDSLSMFSTIAYQCLKERTEDRPTMSMVVEALEKAIEEWKDSTSSAAASECISQTIEIITELAFEVKKVFVEKESFAELTSYLDRIVPLLKELNKNDTSDVENSFVEVLNQQVKIAKRLTAECSQKNRVYLLINSRSITKRIREITREISRALSLIPFSQLGISASMKQDLGQLCDVMQSVEFKTAIADEMILEKIESGIQERNVDRSYANNLLVSIAQVLGISTERSSLKKEFEDFKSEIENAQLRKDQAEAIQMDQIIALLERADATCSPEEKERKYMTKRTSLGSQPLEPLQSFYCPITREVMVDPVETASGHTFERAAIEKWLADGSNFCPLTMTPLDRSSLRPNKTLKQSIEEWKDRNTMITIASLKPKLSKPLAENEEEVICSLEELQKLSEERAVHREWIVLENYIPTLVELLGGKSREIRTRTLVLLCILAKDSDDAKDRIAKVNGVIESIVRSLGRRLSEGKQAVELLLELSQNETLKNRIGMVQGCILLLVTMSNSGDTQAATRARELLAQLSFSDQNVIQMAKANYFTHLLHRLSSGSEEVKMCMVTTLAEMELTDHNKSSLFENGALDSLLHLVSHGNPRMKETAAKALRNLSSLPKNSIQMIRNGSVNPLVNLLYNHTSSHCLQDELAAVIMHLAMSTMSQNYNEPPVPLFESDGDIDTLFSFIVCTRPSVQECLLRSFYAMCHSPLAVAVKTKLRQNPEHVKSLVQMCENESQKVRSNAVKLFCCLSEDGDDKEIIDRIGLNSIPTLIKIIKSPLDEEEISSAMGVLSNLTQSSQLTETLLNADGLPVISTCLRDGMQNRPHKKQLIENTVGSLCHFTIPTNQNSQRKVAESGVIPLLVQLLELGTSLTKRKASIALGQLSKNSSELTHPIPRSLGGIFKCSSSQSESVCPVHQGICTVETSFCLVEADAVLPLVRLLGDSDLNVCEASLDALLTLIEAERLPYGSKVLAEANAIHLIIKLLNCPSSSLQEKVLNALDRMFRLLDLKQKYGHLAQMPLVDLTQRGNNRTKSLATRILCQLNVLHDQSSYF